MRERLDIALLLLLAMIAGGSFIYQLSTTTEHQNDRFDTPQ